MKTLEEVRQRAESDAKTHGYSLNSDPVFLEALLQGLKGNEERYGYPSCPCRLASGKFEFDRDIICPCDYRDPDVEEYGACYCALYIRKDMKGRTDIPLVPERRSPEKQALAYQSAPAEKPSQKAVEATQRLAGNAPRLWYCKQCGYVCFRETPPYVCPICKAKKEMFAEIDLRAAAD